VTTVDAADLTARRVAVTALPGCPRCGIPAAGDPASALAQVYEWLVEAPPPGVTPARRGEAGAADLRDQALRKRHNDYASSPRLPLGAQRGPQSGAQHGDDVAVTIGRLLPTVVGTAAGATPAVDAYLLTGPVTVGGRDVGVFKYDDIRHELIATRADCPPLAETLSGADLAGRTPVAALVLVAAVGRLYGERDLAAFRVAHLAAGAAFAKLLPVAGEAGLRPVAASSWDGRFVELLELRAEQEVVAAVIGLERLEDADAARQ
jgi:hypothetical protein